MKKIIIIILLVSVLKTIAQNDATLDNYPVSFNSGAQIATIDIQNDGKIFIGGNFTSIWQGTSNMNTLVRTNTNGIPDNTFSSSVISGGYVQSVLVQSDGKIIVAKYTFTSGNGQQNVLVRRLNANGTPDNTFATVNGSNYNSYNINMALQNNGKILVWGAFTNFNGNNARLVRLNSDGTIDSTFNKPANITKVSTLAIQPDGKIIISADFSNNGTSQLNSLVRLNSNGSLDNTFNSGTGFNDEIKTITVLSNTKILVGGNFSTFNGINSNRIVCLNSNGSNDSNFNIGTGFNSSVNTISIQSDSKIIVGGNFTSFNNGNINRLIRLNVNGTIDSNFDVGTGMNGEVNGSLINSDGAIYLFGDFTEYKGNNVDKLIRLKGTSLGTNNYEKYKIKIYPNPVNNILYLDTTLNVIKYELIDTLGRVILSDKIVNDNINLEFINKGIYIVRLFTKENFYEQKLIKN